MESNEAFENFKVSFVHRSFNSQIRKNEIIISLSYFGLITNKPNQTIRHKTLKM